MSPWLRNEGAPQSGSSPPSSMLPRSVGGGGYHYTTHDPGAWAPGGPAPLAAPVQDHRRTDLARLEQVMHEEIESANAEAQAKGCVARRYPVARVKHIMKSSMRPQRRVTITHDAVLAMTNLSQVMTGCIAKVAWERTKQRCAGSSSSHCVKLMDAVSATGSMPQFDVRRVNRTPASQSRPRRPKSLVVLPRIYTWRMSVCVAVPH